MGHLTLHRVIHATNNNMIHHLVILSLILTNNGHHFLCLALKATALLMQKQNESDSQTSMSLY